MGVLIIKDGKYPEFTPEQEAMLAKLAAMDDRDIDTSDIPETPSCAASCSRKAVAADTCH